MIKVTIHLENGNDFTIQSNNVSSENKYIQSVSLNGEEYSKSWFRHEDIMNGSELVFEMGPLPNKNWGEIKDSRPSSGNFESASPLPFSVTEDEFFLNTGIVSLKCSDENVKIHYTLDGSRPTEESLLYTKPIELTNSTTIKFTTFKEGLSPSLPVSVKLSKLEFESFKNYEGTMDFDKGLKYKYYHAHVMEEHDLDKLTPIETGIIPNLTIENRQREDYFGYIYSGFLDIPKGWNLYLLCPNE